MYFPFSIILSLSATARLISHSCPCVRTYHTQFAGPQKVHHEGDGSPNARKKGFFIGKLQQGFCPLGSKQNTTDS